MSQPPYQMPLVIRQGEHVPSVQLGGVELTGVLGMGGVRIETNPDPFDVRNPFIVTLTFCEGALDVDIEIDLLRDLLAKAEAKSA